MFRLKRISGNHFTPAYVFGRYWKLGQAEVIFCVDCKITLLTRKTTSGFILPSNDLHFSHTLLKLLTRTPHRHHWYSPSSIMAKVHPLSHAKCRSTLSLMPVRAPLTVWRAPLIHPRWVSSTVWVHFSSTTSHHLRSTLYFSLTTSPHLRSTIHLSPTTSPHLQSTHLRPTLYKSRSTSLHTPLAVIHL